MVAFGTDPEGGEIREHGLWEGTATVSIQVPTITHMMLTGNDGNRVLLVGDASKIESTHVVREGGIADAGNAESNCFDLQGGDLDAKIDGVE